MSDSADNLPDGGPDTSMDAAVAALLAREDEADTGDEGASPDGPDASAPNPDAPRKFRVKVDGEEQEVDEAELISGYSFRAHNTRAAQKLAEERKSIETKAREYTEKLERLTKALPEIERIAESELQDRFSAVDWNELKRTNPTEFAALRADYDIERERLSAVKAERKKAEDELTERRQNEFQEWASKQYEALLERNPDWKDEQKRTEAMTRIATYAGAIGYSPEEVANLYDHRAYMLLDKAEKYDALMARVNAAKNGGGRPKPKPAAPAGRTATTLSGSERERAALARLSKTNRVEDAVAALLARGK